ncbi:hypothetical protein FBUS_07743 [Fasciolopsis buskii]|uniref:Uncharacterized protein n=1 Tax=Fasciolopsis buskii TaxID=27845 RepID=A0A8E0VKY0_9TREM|nr:hypothetical protein FBUS_07743 [Fasciolopsis buski]
MKVFTPGGEAEADGSNHMFNQIVEVNRKNLAGVPHKLAAHTLMNITNVVHFILAGESDPPSRRVAQPLAEQKEKERLCQASLDECRRFDNDEEPSTVILREDSAETLHRLMTDAAETAVRAMAEPASEDEDEGDVREPLDEEADEVAADGDSLYDGEVRQTSEPERAIDTADGSSTAPGVPNIPCSALKDTATAASTNGHQEAIIQLIHSAFNRSKSTGSSTDPSEENSLSTPAHVTSKRNSSTEPLVLCGSSEPQVAIPTLSEANSPATNRGSLINFTESKQLFVEAKPLLTLISTINIPTPGSSSSRKSLCVKLPGLLSAGQVALRHLERNESAPPVTTEFSAAEVRRYTDMAPLSSIKRFPRSQ